jgi:hypothetical protein
MWKNFLAKAEAFASNAGLSALVVDAGAADGGAVDEEAVDREAVDEAGFSNGAVGACSQKGLLNPSIRGVYRRGSLPATDLKVELTHKSSNAHAASMRISRMVFAMVVSGEQAG